MDRHRASLARVRSSLASGELRPFLFRNIPPNRRRANHVTVAIGHRRYGQRHVDQTAVLRPPDRLARLDTTAGAHCAQNFVKFASPVVGNQQCNRTPAYFLAV